MTGKIYYRVERKLENAQPRPVDIKHNAGTQFPAHSIRWAGAIL